MRHKHVSSTYPTKFDLVAEARNGEVHGRGDDVNVAVAAEGSDFVVFTPDGIGGRYNVSRHTTWYAVLKDLHWRAAQ
jgi:hypothetical protein